MSSLLSLFSRRRERMTSFSLRSKRRSGVSSSVFTTCCVIVLPPWTTRLFATFVMKARAAEGADTGMGVEVGVRGGEEGLAHLGRHALQRDDIPPLDVELAEHGTVLREDLRGRRRLIAHQLIDGREIPADLPVHHVAN